MDSTARKPSLFIIGSPKSGTSALHEYLKQHPAIFMSNPKEPNYFAQDFCRDPEPNTCFHQYSESEYLELFKQAAPDQVCGESSACYLYSKVAAQTIHQFNPDAKLICILREPVDFLYSYHLQSLKNRITEAETEKNFETALELEVCRKSGQNIPPKCLIPEFLFYRERIKYVEQLERFHALFKAENIKVYIYDDWKHDNLAIFKNILQFIGVDDTFQPSLALYNQGGKAVRSKSLQDFLFNLSHGVGSLGLLQKVIKGLVPQVIRKSLLQSASDNLAFKQASPLGSDFVIQLKQEFKPEVEKLSHFLQRDLVSLWNY